MKNLEQEQMPALEPIEKDGFWYQKIKILNQNGLHARPSAKFYEKVLQPYGNKLDLSFQLSEGADYTPISSVFDLMSLGLERGAEFNIKVKFLGDASEFDDESIPPSQQIVHYIHDLFLNNLSLE